MLEFPGPRSVCCQDQLAARHRNSALQRWWEDQGHSALFGLLAVAMKSLAQDIRRYEAAARVAMLQTDHQTTR